MDKVGVAYYPKLRTPNQDGVMSIIMILIKSFFKYLFALILLFINIS